MTRARAAARILALHGGLFAATAATTAWSYFAMSGDWGEAGLFAFSTLLILGAHEMGHFVMARVHGVACSWPYFIPVPFGFGTLGAVIRLRGKIPSRDALLDIGAAGPLAGILVAIPLLVVGVMLSTPMEAAEPPFPPTWSLITIASDVGKALRAAIDGVPLPATEGTRAVTYFGDNLLTLAISRVVWGPLPPGTDLNAHPVFVAAWFGLLVTMLNLLPVGQLDGGHITRAALGKSRAELIGPQVASLALILALLCSSSWLVWFFLATRLVGFAHPPPADDETPMSRGRRAVVALSWAATVLCFIPVPMDMIVLP